MKKLLFTLLLAAAGLSGWADDPTALYVVGNATTADWTIGNAQVLYKTSNKHYEGFVMFKTVQEEDALFKILCQKVDNTWAPFWGSSGYGVTVDSENPNQLTYYSNSGEGTFKSTFTGLYLVTVNLTTGSETISFQEWGDATYSIDNAGQLQAFSDCVNRFKPDMNAVLTADISMSTSNSHTPIGTETNKYVGTFDGDGHSIYLNINRNEDYQGLFGRATRGAKFKNLIITGSVSGKSCSAALVGEVGADGENGTIEISNVGIEANVTTSGSSVAAFVGNDWGWREVIKMENCYNIGNITGGGNVSAIGNYFDTGSTLTNVYNKGTITNTSGSNSGMFTTNDRGSFSNCYTTTSGNNGGTGVSGLTQGITNTQITLGELCYKLNDGTDVWKQKIGGAKGYPNFNDTEVVNVVVANTTYSNLAANDGKVQIDDADDLVQFSAEVKAGNTSMDAELTDDIDMTSVTGWTPIGQDAKDYAGHFNGQNHRILSLSTSAGYNNQALFGQAVGPAVIENVIIDSSCTIQGVRFVAGILGFVFGNHASGVTVRNCGNEANVHGYGNGTESVCAGIVACTNSGNGGSIVHIENCYNTGRITGQNNNAGICAWMGSASSTMTNCYNIGSVSNGDPISRGENGANCTNNYSYSPSDEEVTGGELCAKLGYAFRQNIGEDDYPNFNATHGFVNQISAAGYSTQYNTYSDVTIPDGIEAFAGVKNGEEWLRLVPITGNIAKDEPVILRGNAGLYNFMPTTGISRAASNELSGSNGTVSGDGSTIYALAKKGEPAEVGFYLVNNGLKIPEGRAYLEIVGDIPGDGPGGVKGFTFVFEDTEDGIKTLSNSPLKGENIYNLAGQRINKMQKGINIVNGKKIMK